MTERTILNDGDVISMKEDKNLTFKPTSKVSEIKSEIMERFDDDNCDWVKSGVPCEYLSTKGNGWVKGKVRIEVSFEPEFVPDKISTSSESSLNDLREKLSSERRN